MHASHPTSILAAAISVAAIAAGCASPTSRGDAYEQALAQWQGATEELLVSRWGKPVSEEQVGSGKWLTFVVLNGPPAPPPTVAFSIGGFGFGGGRHSGVGVGGGVSTVAPIGPPGAAPTCTTRFLIEDGKVSTWAFDGTGCGTVG